MKRFSQVGVRRPVVIPVVMLGLMLGQVALALAATTSVAGSAVTIDPLNNFGATVQDQVLTNWSKILGVILVIGGALSMLRLPALGAIGVVAGLLIIFSNPIIEATFTGTSAMPLAAATATAAPWNVPLLLRPLLVLAYYPYLFLLTLQAWPWFWGLLALTLRLRRRITGAYRRVAV
jgi:hypothetical protein